VRVKFIFSVLSATARSLNHQNIWCNKLPLSSSHAHSPFAPYRAESTPAVPNLEPLITLIKSVKVTSDVPAALKAIAERHEAEQSPDDLMTAIYIVAKLLYSTWAKNKKGNGAAASVAKHAALSQLVSRLLEVNKLDLDTIERIMDHESRSVVQFSCNTTKSPEATAIGLSKIDDTLTLSSSVAPQVFATFISYFISIYNLDESVVLEKVLINAANHIAYPINRASDMPGGFDGNQMDDPYALIFYDIRLSAGSRQILHTFQPDRVKSIATHILENKSSVKLALDKRVLLGYALIRDAILPVQEVMKLFEDKKTRDEAWKKYAVKAAELAENGAYITKPRDLKKNRPSPIHDCWKTTPSDRDIFLLEEFLDVGPWHECGGEFPLVELELLVLFIRCCRWKEAAEIFKYLEADNSDLDFVAHPPVAKALSNLALAMLQGLLSEHFEFLYPNAKKRYDAMKKLDESFLSPIENHNQLFEKEGGVFAEILLKLGSHTRRNPALIFGIIRLIQDEDIGENGMVSKYLQYVLLPALQLTTANSALSLSIWKIIRLAPHTVRWDMYKYCQNIAPKRNIQIAVSNAHASYETRSVMKRVTVDTYEDFQRTMGKISTGQALSLGAAFIRRVQGYAPDKKTLEPFVQMLSKATPLSLDMLMYLIVEALGNDEKEKMKTDGTNFEMWFAATSLLAGIFLRKAKIESCSFDGMLTFLKQRIVDKNDPAYVEVLKDRRLGQVVNIFETLYKDTSIKSRKNPLPGPSLTHIRRRNAARHHWP